MEDKHDTLALRHRRKKSSISITACFHLGSSHSDSLATPSSSAPSPNFLKSPSSWFKLNKHRSPELADTIKPKRRNIICRMGRHRRHASADFHYDPLSYALNFEDDEAAAAEVDHDRNRDFASRLPVTPPRTRPVDDLAPKMEVLELRGKRDHRRRESSGGELKNTVFEVRTPRGKGDSGKSPRSPSNDGRRNFDVTSPRSPRVAQEILA